MPKILGVTWPRPRPFWGILFLHPLEFSKTKLCTKFEVYSLSSLEDMFDCMPKNLGIIITWPRPRPFWGKLFTPKLGFFKAKLYTKFEVSSSSSFEDIFDWMLKILGVTWPRLRPLWGKFCIFLFKFAKVYNCDKYEVSTFNIFCFIAVIMLSPVICLYENGHCAMRMRCVTWPVCRGPATTKNLETLTPICLFTIQLSGGYDDD